jgi:excisionase family DNA binding protein
LKKWNKCDEVARLFNVKRATVWRWIRTGKLEAVRLGKNYRIEDTALKKFIDDSFASKE